MSGPIDWRRVRADFPILDQRVEGDPLIYFDNAATSQKPRAVIEALVRHYERDNANVHRGLHELSRRSTDAYEAARSTVATFLGAASADEIIFTRGVTEAVNLVANIWADHFLKPGDVVLLTGMEHHSNLVPWQLAARRTGATLRFIPVGDDGQLDLATWDQLLTPEIRIFSFVHVSNSLGTINPAAALCARARDLGITTFVDGAQSAGHIPVDVRQLGCDFFAFSAHKLCGPTGIGALYGRRERLDSMPPWQGGGEMINRVTLEESTFKPPPARFEAGTPHIAGAIGMAAALDYLAALGLDAIAEHDAALTAHARGRLREVPGLRIFGPEAPRGALVSFTLDGVHPHDLVTFANARGLALRGGHHCTQPLLRRFGVAATTRASFYFYNTRDEIDQMIEILHDAHRFFAP
ncbi:MAG: SufS family cysteine desulfurase [Verrucomicrobiales bacterium]